MIIICISGWLIAAIIYPSSMYFGYLMIFKREIWQKIADRITNPIKSIFLKILPFLDYRKMQNGKLKSAKEFIFEVVYIIIILVITMPLAVGLIILDAHMLGVCS